MPHGRPFPALLACLLLATGCARLPVVTPELQAAAAQRSADPGREAETLRAWGERIGGRPFVAGNAVTLLQDGSQTFPALEAAIQAARTSITMESYEFDNEEGRHFGDLLLARRAQGVDVHLLYDAWGAADTRSGVIARLRQGGITVLEYNPLRPTARVALDLNRRDHRKLLVVDGRVVLTGGVNISRVYENRQRAASGPSDPDPDAIAWRDTDIRIEGPVAAEFGRIFAQGWSLQHGPALPPPPPPPWALGNASVQALDGTPDRQRPEIYRSLLVAITLAEHSVHLTTGFFVPPPDLRHALEDAARRGVDVQLVLPAHSDSDSALAAGRGYYAELLRAGIALHERQGVVLHAKTAVIDGLWSAVGSSNLDFRSVLLNNEIEAVVLGREFAALMEQLFARDLAHSTRIEPAAWARRSPAERLREWKAALVEYFL